MFKNWRLLQPLTITTAIFAAAYFRLAGLGVPALWIDEVLLMRFIQQHSLQELVPQALTSLSTSILGRSEFAIRLPFALSGILTVAALPLVMRKTSAIPAMIFVAVFPLFVFWSRTARPYAMAGLFIVLAWRWKWCLLPAIMCTPIAIIGAHITSLKDKWFYLLMLALAIVIFLIRTDTGERNFFDPNFFLNVRRIWYVPALVATLWIADHLFNRAHRADPIRTGGSKGDVVE